MPVNPLDREFKGSCVTIEYPCTVGDKYVDPCNCQNWYQCGSNQASFISQSCANGTLFNHQTETCQVDTDVAVIDKLCDPKKTWERCTSATGGQVDMDALQERCTGVAKPTLPGGSAEEQRAQGAGTGVDNTGPIVGGVIAAVLLVALVVAVVFFLRKKGKPISHYLSFMTLKRKDSSTYAEYDNREETYSEIKDVAMNDPTYGNPEVSTRPSFMAPSPNFGNDKTPIRGRLPQEEVAYDNPGYDKSNDDDTIGCSSLSSSRVSNDLSVSQNAENPRSHSPIAPAALESPTPKSYTPLSVYTRGPNTPVSVENDGNVATDENGYQVPRQIPDYCDLQPGSNSVS